jgi:hypothetical protein
MAGDQGERSGSRWRDIRNVLDVVWRLVLLLGVAWTGIITLPAMWLRIVSFVITSVAMLTAVWYMLRHGPPA